MIKQLKVKKQNEVSVKIRLILTLLLTHVITYYGTRFFTTELHHYNMTTFIENSIPFLPWTIVIYLGCYLFWIINYVLGCLQDLRETSRFLYADIIAKVICFLCFLMIPTTNIRPNVDGIGFFADAMKWLYSVDAADNLFPSIHCLTSWLCVIAVRKQNKIPAWYKALSVVMAILVFVSTLTTKQHVIVDVVAGMLLAEFGYMISGIITGEENEQSNVGIPEAR